MSDTFTLLSSLRRPGLLVRAARHGMSEYSRDRTLARLIGTTSQTPPEEAVPKLIEAESEAEQTRRRDDGTYSAARHVDLLIALMAEARLLSARGSDDRA